MAELSPTTPKRRFLLECSGACGDLGTFIPHVTGAITVAGLAPAGVLFGFAAFLIATGLLYRLPLPVQPMKAISAVILTGGLRPGEVAAAGMIIGVVLLVLGITGWIGRLARAIPQSVSAGLQLGLGLLDAAPSERSSRLRDGQTLRSAGLDRHIFCSSGRVNGSELPECDPRQRDHAVAPALAAKDWRR